MKTEIFIENSLDTLGLLEGLYEVERALPQLKVGENLLVAHSAGDLEPCKVVSAVEENDERSRKDNS